MSVHRSAAAYFALQGAAVLAWWGWLAVTPGARASFFPEGTPTAAMLAFAPADVLVLGVPSLAAALLIFRRHAWAAPAAWLVAGAIDHATLHVLAWCAQERSGWLGFVAMGPAAVLSTNFALAVTPAPLFRASRGASAVVHLLATFAQVVVFWSVFLAAVPWGLREISRDLGLPGFGTPWLTALGASLFAACSALGLWSAAVMATRGSGTPLPFDTASRLVTEGPYAHVRNPMAMSGLGQGVAVALMLGDWLVLGYALLGTAVWHVVVRPPEEADLLARFGDPYRRYRAEVRCWWPRRTPYAASGTAGAREKSRPPE